MAEVQKGKGIVWGVDGITFTAGIVTGTNAAALQSGQFERTSDKVDIQNGDGDTIAQVFYNFKRRLSITAIPHGTTFAAAATSVDAYMPKPGTLVTVVDGDGTLIDGDYNIISARQSRTNTGAAAIDFELERFEDNNVTTVIS